MKELQTDKVKLFIKEVIELSRKHRLSISHEDGQGSFLICEFKDYHSDWFTYAADETEGGIKNYRQWIKENTLQGS